MEVGKLRHRVDLRLPSSNRDSVGQAITDHSTYATVWARVTPLSGRELEHADQISAETTHKVVIRYNSSVAATHRVNFNGRVLEIESIVNPEERNIMQILMCKEVA